MDELFGGVALPDAYFPALHRICVAFNTVDERLINELAYSVEVMVEEYSPDDRQRIWWHSRDQHGKDTWISINPGEFRTEPPDSPCRIREMPKGAPRQTTRNMLRAAIEALESFPHPGHEGPYLARAKELLSRSPQGAQPELYTAIQSIPASAEPQEIQSHSDKLYQDFFFSFRNTISDFTDCITLMHIQYAINMHIEQNWSSNPSKYLSSYIKLICTEDSYRERFLQKIIDLAHKRFHSGRKLIGKGLDGSMEDLSENLMMACHNFLSANTILNLITKFGISPQRIQLNPNVVEEAFVCTWTGIHVGARFCMKHPNTYPLKYHANNGPILKDLQRAARRDASEIQPIFTRSFAKILAAQALTSSDHKPDIENGLSELERLNKNQSHAHNFEQSWIDHALLNAYRRVGDENNAKRMAIQIAAKLTLRLALI